MMTSSSAVTDTKTNPEKQARQAQVYGRGPTPFYAYAPDSPLSYCLYVPTILDRSRPVHLIVAIHGSDRIAESYRDAFGELARYSNAIVLAPLFPVDVLGDGNPDGYKYIQEGALRYDLAVLGMMDAVARKYDVTFDKVCMFGFSGGAHFTHRFLLLHPTRITAASIAAPGSVTLVDDSQDWWVGTRNMEALFGVRLNPPAIAQVAIQLVIGEADRETWEIMHRPGDRYWMEGANDAGGSRPERIVALQRSLEAQGATVSLKSLPGVSHTFRSIVGSARDFFWDHLRAR